MRRLRSFLGLLAREKRLLVESLLTVAIATVAVAAMPFSLLHSWTTHKARLKARKNFSQEQIGWSVSAAARFVPWSTCVAEALATQVLMRRCGYDPIIRVGVRKRDDGEFTAHAWVESEGKVVAGDNSSLDKYDRLSVF